MGSSRDKLSVSPPGPRRRRRIFHEWASSWGINVAFKRCYLFIFPRQVQPRYFVPWSTSEGQSEGNVALFVSALESPPAMARRRDY
ncbi:hypothetical protein E2C01_101038 [Portunus trituberculatus]|uniref:Uncharacterized protein n=1 Tax=Portunus trituberculatus TaxID=210409 RepID=A0A5B7K9L3_PORTR|nr:hypothetical protein [Portunus trituberculatus]